MPRPVKLTPRGEAKSPEELAAEKSGQDILFHYCRMRPGRAAQLARQTGLLPGVISRMSNYLTPVSCEVALLLEVATKGELKAVELCPARAGLLKEYVALANKAKETEAQQA
jgi:DNA-binding transcriptional regulator YdaS (Cro superfamily)